MSKNAPDKAPEKAPDTDHGQSVIERTVELMKTERLGWSKAME